MPGAHARLSASSAARWINCPPSAALAEQFPDTGSSYAAAGTLAHAIAEYKARCYFLEPVAKRTYNAQLAKFKKDPAYDNGMDHATDIYLEELKQVAMSYDEPPFVALEVRVDYSHIAPEGFGTADCVMISADGTMHIIDYKNGAGVPVGAENNPQLMLYALGALKTYEILFGDIGAVGLHIVQPNAGGVKRWAISTNDLWLWANDIVKPAAALAYEGKGDFCPGPWCDDHFCPARATCMARAKQMLALEEYALDPSYAAALLTDDQVGELLSRAENLQKWAKALQDYAFTAALSGRRIPGYKLVEGRSSRDWSDQDKAFETMQARGIPEALLYERKPVSVAGLEKALGKADFNKNAADLVARKPGKPALVPESDKRQEWTPAAAAFEAINN